ncbi:MAG: glycoside hydrolase family 28 protein [Bacteroidales bacterium]|nr:glycoside hydrolase family 28 protein [Bacteroidales bacterium]
MTILKRIAVCIIAFIAIASCNSGYEFAYLYEDLPFEMEQVKRPQIPVREVDIRDFGGIGDGVTLNSEAFAKAIDALTEAGGGRLVVPTGVWLSGPITLKDNIDLHIRPDAVLLFSTDRDLYPIVETVFEGLDTKRCISPINAVGAKNIAITGGGTIDGNGDSWRQVKKSKMAPSQWKELLRSGGFTNEKGDLWYPDSSSFYGAVVSDAFNVPQGLTTDEQWNKVKTYLRPVMISLKDCENVLLEDCLFQNSPCWNIHPLMCRNVIINNVTVRNPWYSQNGDGLDVDSCENVLVINSSFDVGDDAICIKSGKDEDGRRRARPCRNLIVHNCIVFHGHGGFVVGSEMSGGVENIKVSDCRFLGTDVGLRFKSCRGRGGVVKNIHIEDIVMMNIPTEPLLFDLHYGGKSAVEAAAEGASPFDVEFVEADETTPQFRDIFIRDIVCSGAARAMYFNGIPEKNIENIVVENCEIVSEKGADLRYSTGVILKDVKITQSEGEGFSIANCRDVVIEDCEDAAGKDIPEVFQYNSKNVSIE